MPAHRRKRYLPTVFVALIAWLLFFFLVFFVDPQVIRDFPVSGSYFLFFFILFFCVFLTASFLFAHTRRGLLTATALVFFLYLRIYGLGHLLNAILLAAFFVVLELALSHRP